MVLAVKMYNMLFSTSKSRALCMVKNSIAVGDTSLMSILEILLLNGSAIYRSFPLSARPDGFSMPIKISILNYPK